MSPFPRRSGAMGRALSRYRRLPLMVRLHNRIRAATCPFRLIERIDRGYPYPHIVYICRKNAGCFRG